MPTQFKAVPPKKRAPNTPPPNALRQAKAAPSWRGAQVGASKAANAPPPLRRQAKAPTVWRGARGMALSVKAKSPAAPPISPEEQAAMAAAAEWITRGGPSTKVPMRMSKGAALAEEHFKGAGGAVDAPPAKRARVRSPPRFAPELLDK